MWSILKEVLFNVFGTIICILFICWGQHKLFELTEDFMPHPTQWAKSKTHSAYEFYKCDKGNNDDKRLQPCRQREECNEHYNSYEYDEPPVGLFSSTWTHFCLLVERICTHYRECLTKSQRLYFTRGLAILTNGKGCDIIKLAL